MSLCTSALDPEPVIGSVVAREVGAAGCVFRDDTYCDASSMDVEDDAGEIVTFGFCTPAGYEPPPVGARVSVEGNAVGWDLCDQRRLEVRDESGELLFLGLQASSNLDAAPLTIERRLACHVDDGDYLERYSLEVSLGGDTVAVSTGDTTRLGPYVIDFLDSHRTHLCEGGWDCNASGIMDFHTLVVQHDPLD